MEHFPDKLRVSPDLTDLDYWILNAPFSYITLQRQRITAPVAFKTNFATVPKIFRNIMQPWGNHGKAAVIHDYLYTSKTKTRKQADKIFLEAMKVSGVGYLKRKSLYRIVRLFGGSHYGG